MKRQITFSKISPVYFTGTAVKTISSDFTSTCSLTKTNFITNESISIDSDYTFTELFSNENNLFVGQSNGEFSIFNCENFDKIFTNKVSNEPIVFSYNNSKNVLAVSNDKNVSIFDVNKQAFFPSINLPNQITSLKFNDNISHVLAIGTTNNLILSDLRQKKVLLQINTDRINRVAFNSDKNTTLLYQCSNLLYSFDLINDTKLSLCNSNDFILYNKFLINLSDKLNLFDMNYKLLSDKFLTNFYQIAISEYYKDLIGINYVDGRTEVLSLSALFNNEICAQENRVGMCIYRNIRQPISLNDNDSLEINKITLFQHKSYLSKEIYKFQPTLFHELKNKQNLNEIINLDEEKESFFNRKDPLLRNLILGQLDYFKGNSEQFNILFIELINSYFPDKFEFLPTNPILLLLSLINGAPLSQVYQSVNPEDWDILILFIYNNIKNNKPILAELAELIKDKTKNNFGSLICYILADDKINFIKLRKNKDQIISLSKYKEFISEYLSVYYENKDLLNKEDKDFKEFERFINQENLNEINAESHQELQKLQCDKLQKLQCNELQKLQAMEVQKLQDMNLQVREEIKPPINYSAINRGGIPQINIKSPELGSSINQRINSPQPIDSFQTSSFKASPPIGNLSQPNIPNRSTINSNPNINQQPMRPPMSSRFNQPAPYPNQFDNTNYRGITNQPMMNQPINPQPIRNQPMMNQPMMNQQINPQPMMNQPMMNQQINPQPMMNQPINPQPNFNSQVEISNQQSNINSHVGINNPHLSYNQSINSDKKTYGTYKNNGIRQTQNSNIYSNPSTSTTNAPGIPKPTLGYSRGYPTNSSSSNISAPNPVINAPISSVNDSYSNINAPAINTSDPELLRNEINAKIIFLKEESLAKKGLVYKSKTNSALSRIEKYDLNGFNINLLLELNNLFSKISINEIKERKLEIKSQLLTVSSIEVDRISREYAGTGLDVYVGGVFMLLQVVLS